MAQEPVDVKLVIAALRNRAETGRVGPLNDPGSAVNLGTLGRKEVEALLTAAEVGASDAGVERVAAAVVPKLRDMTHDMTARTLMALAPILRRVRPALERTKEAVNVALRLGGDDKVLQEERLALHALIRLSDAMNGSPLPPPAASGIQADGSFLLATGEILEAVGDYLTARGYELIGETPLAVDIDPITFEVRVRATVRSGSHPFGPDWGVDRG